MSVAVCQLEKKGVVSERSKLNRSIQKANCLIRKIRAQIGKLKEWEDHKINAQKFENAF